jgi:hypothetical protein
MIGSEDVPKQVLCKTRSTKGVNIPETQSTIPPIRQISSQQLQVQAAQRRRQSTKKT